MMSSPQFAWWDTVRTGKKRAYGNQPDARLGGSAGCGPGRDRRLPHHPPASLGPPGGCGMCISIFSINNNTEQMEWHFNYLSFL